MVISKEEIRKIVSHIQSVRMMLLLNHPFYGSLLMHIPMSLDKNCDTAYTDGEKIYFSPDFIKNMSDNELSFVMLHELLHIVFQHCTNRKREQYDQELYNIACDIVINSNILYSFHHDIKSITLHEFGVGMHLAPNKKEGYLYNSDEVYKMLIQKEKSKQKPSKKDSKNDKNKQSNQLDGKNDRFDDHSKWKEIDKQKQDEMEKHIVDSAILASEKAKQKRGPGNIPFFVEILLKELRNPQLDWKTLLQNFIQEEINDYTFNPPDNRFEDSPFFLPSFQEKDEYVKDILFMVDTSGSMDSQMITDAFSEIKGAIEQFQGHLQGKLGFFDSSVKGIYPFEDVESLLKMKPIGGGGTSFIELFRYIHRHFEDEQIVGVIILTDGYAPFPKEEGDIPVLWILNNQEIHPPFGKIARIS